MMPGEGTSTMPKPHPPVDGSAPWTPPPSSARARRMAAQDLEFNHRDTSTFLVDVFRSVHGIAENRFEADRCLRPEDVRSMERSFARTMTSLSGSVPIVGGRRGRADVSRWVVPVRHGGTLRTAKAYLAIKKKRWILNYFDGCTQISRHALERMYDRTSAACATRRIMAALAEWEPVVRWLTHAADPETEHAGLMVPTDEGWLEVGLLAVPPSNGGVVSTDRSGVIRSSFPMACGPEEGGVPTHRVAVVKTFISVKEPGPKWRLETHRALAAIHREEAATFRDARKAIVEGKDVGVHGELERVLTRVSDVHDRTPPRWRAAHVETFRRSAAEVGATPAFDLELDEPAFKSAIESGFSTGSRSVYAI